MGFKINTYSIEELNKISSPGKIVPVLFWLIPIGEWDNDEIRKLWDLFTGKKSQSKCAKLGLMLIKDPDNHHNSSSNKSTGNLLDLFPAGVKEIYSEKYHSPKDKKKQILILSGSYPQPGWGILISYKKDQPNNIETELENILNEQIDNEGIFV